MTTGQPQPKVQLATTPDYRENYANSVQMRVSLWDFFLLFGTIQQTAPDTVTIQNFQGIFLSPPQAKALSNVLQQNRAVGVYAGQAAAHSRAALRRLRRPSRAPRLSPSPLLCAACPAALGSASAVSDAAVFLG